MITFDKRVDRRLNKGVEKLLKAATTDGVIPIVTAGEPVLRKQAQRYSGQLSEKTLKKLISVMRTTMLHAPGVGLAGPQVGLPLALAVIEDRVSTDSDTRDVNENNDSDEEKGTDPREISDLPFRVIINPQYEPVGQETRSFYEGCLSVPGFQAVRKRWHTIDASWQDEAGNQHTERLHGWPARIFQHETDHLSGQLYIDKAEIRSLTSDDNLGEYWWDPTPTKAAEVLGFEL